MSRDRLELAARGERILSATNLLKEEQKKQTKQERTREIMKYYVVGKLKYIIEGNCTFTI